MTNVIMCLSCLYHFRLREPKAQAQTRKMRIAQPNINVGYHPME